MKRPVLLALALMALTKTARADGFSLHTTAFRDGGTIPAAQVFNRLGCTGNDISPALAWSGAPAGTRSYAVTLFDPDARRGKGYWHWIVANIPARVTSLPEGSGSRRNALPRGTVQGNGSGNIHGYQGPCPPVGDPPHHYHLTVYALRIARLPAAALASHAALRRALAQDALASATITGLYGRPAR
ncbi:YbhB/YbcL family Raf kinase inhibitor-like protein [Acidiphilium sp. C61]|uniref:YbhB/YbcL family Raf kinase inhibitor-like protein n=1 Tax=Acidiphilium sp. C61 TaxID=1671485 RepID=UPI00157B7C24|nr:YbhB/YbcL family Raf kinase inhibitor-like protein [Acidiphilium sp. C61]